MKNLGTIGGTDYILSKNGREKEMIKTSALNVVFIGQNSLATFIPLGEVAKHHNIIGIIESAPRGFTNKQSRLKKIINYARQFYTQHSLKRYANTNKLPYYLLTKNGHDGMIEFLNRLKPDVICVSSMSQLLKPEAFNIPKHGTINLHSSFLPEYRGPNPIFWQIYNMETQGGVTVHYIDVGEDTGDIIKQERFPIRMGTTAEEILLTAKNIGAKLLVEALNEIAAGNVHRYQQQAESPTERARNIKPDEHLIDWEAWGIERTWHVLRGTRDRLNAIPVPKGIFNQGYFWEIGQYELVCDNEKPGSVYKRDGKHYISHKDGRILLNKCFSIKKFVLELIRKVL